MTAPTPSRIPMHDRERARCALDRLLELLAAHPPSSGALRIRFDRQGHLHLEWRDVVAELDGLLTHDCEGRTL
jgi:hypothetical protein